MCSCTNYYCIGIEEYGTGIGVARVLFLFSFGRRCRLDGGLVGHTARPPRSFLHFTTSLVIELVNGTRCERLPLLLLLLFIPPPVHTRYTYYLFLFFFCFQNGRVSTVCCLERASTRCCHVPSLIKPIPIRLTSSRAVHFTRSSSHALAWPVPTDTW